MLKRFNACVAIVALLAFTSCGDENNGTNNSTTPNNGTTAPNNGTATNNGTVDPNNGTTPTGGTTAPTEQCGAQGDACETGKATKNGFVCVRPDANSDATCQTACQDPSDPTIPAGDGYTCSSGQLCLDSGNGAFACVRSDCTGLLDTTSCAATESCFSFNDVIREDPADNESTILREGSANFCTAPAANAVGLGEDCTTINGCEAGLTCIGTCVLPCGDDTACTVDGEACVGEEGNFLAQGVGFCEVKCSPYKADSGCEGADSCNPLTSTEGICVDNIGTVAAYEACTNAENAPPEESCGANLRCIGVQGTPNPLAICLPFCDPTLATPGAQSATCEGVDAHCFDLATDEARPNSGVCFASCSAADYGNNTCAGTGNACTPINGDRHACFPGTGVATLGETCNPLDRETACVEGLSCAADSTGTGTCISYCEPNPVEVTLGCQADETCSPIGSAAFNFGVCGKTCTPTNFADANCPANLKNCIRQEVADTQAVCSASGNVALGAVCPSITTNTCLAGDTCVNAFSRTLAGGQAGFDAAGQCTKQCDLFTETSGCEGTDVCLPSFGTFSETVGYCATKGMDAVFGAPCDSDTACGPTSACLAGPNNTTQCIPLCRISDSAGCDGSCDQLFDGATLAIGICRG